MSWWGLLLGGAFGYLLGGPIGALLGAAMGRGFGRSPSSIGLEESGSERTQLAFFAAVFGVMGHVAKADGRVTPEEIGLANQVMDQLGLDARQRAAARALFDEGKRPEFPLDAVLDQLRSECGRATNLIRMFVEIQIQAAAADRRIHAEEGRILLHVASRLGLSRAEYLQLERLIASGIHSSLDPDSGMSLDVPHSRSLRLRLWPGPARRPCNNRPRSLALPEAFVPCEARMRPSAHRPMRRTRR